VKTIVAIKREERMAEHQSVHASTSIRHITLQIPGSQRIAETLDFQQKRPNSKSPNLPVVVFAFLSVIPLRESAVAFVFVILSVIPEWNPLFISNPKIARCNLIPNQATQSTNQIAPPLNYQQAQ
jgi:hypothetical protein